MFDLFIFDCALLKSDQAIHWIYYRKPAEARVAMIAAYPAVGLRYWRQLIDSPHADKLITEQQARGEALRVAAGAGVDHNLIIYSFAYQSQAGRWGPRPDGAGVAWTPNYCPPGTGAILEAIGRAGANPSRTLLIGDDKQHSWAASAAHIAWLSPGELFSQWPDVAPVRPSAILGSKYGQWDWLME